MGAKREPLFCVRTWLKKPDRKTKLFAERCRSKEMFAECQVHKSSLERTSKKILVIPNGYCVLIEIMVFDIVL